jgi:hypothetical protein
MSTQYVCALVTNTTGIAHSADSGFIPEPHELQLRNRSAQVEMCGAKSYLLTPAISPPSILTPPKGKLERNQQHHHRRIRSAPLSTREIGAMHFARESCSV